jgi:hypothetical protein
MTLNNAISRRPANSGLHGRHCGTVLVATLACMAIVMAIVGGMLQGALRARRQLHTERNFRQVELLLEAGVDRAASRLFEDDAYSGETWEIPADHLLGNGAGAVVITATRPGNDRSWQVRVAAEYPVGTVTSVRRSRTFSVEL